MNKSLTILIISIIAIFAAIRCMFLYTNEKLICNIDTDSCIVQKTNVYNIKKEFEIAKYSEVKKARYIYKRLQGNAYASSLTEYYLGFELKNNETVQIFEEPYLEYKNIGTKISDIQKSLKNKESFTVEK